MKITVDEVMASPPIAEPYKLLDASLLSDGAAAVILATEAWAGEHSIRHGTRPSVVLTGTGVATDTARLADRTLSAAGLAHFAGKRLAAEQAYAMAGIVEPFSEVDVAEVYDSFSGAELQAYEDLGLCEQGHGGLAATDGRFDHGGRLPVNTSGGLLGRGGAMGATGLAQTVEIVLQLRGEAGPRQVEGASRGLTDTHGGVGSNCVVNIFERREEI
ncbi:MAG: thiolase family protein [Actinobacteria bacterium]|nr:thiolase family protein [Actinomycetota bacterium]